MVCRGSALGAIAVEIRPTWDSTRFAFGCHKLKLTDASDGFLPCQKRKPVAGTHPEPPSSPPLRHLESERCLV